MKKKKIILQDGGLLANNPTWATISEIQDTWDDIPIDCIISLGTGIVKETKRKKGYHPLH